MPNANSHGSNRRSFMKATAATAAAASLLAPSVHAAGSDVIKIGLVGCGGRGRGAASDALKADPQVKLVAMCDIFPDVLAAAHDVVKGQFKDRVETGDRLYSGFDGYKQLIDNAGCDIVLLCTPPGFRPVHLKYAVEAGKNVFAEKPMAVDIPGVKSVIESAKLAAKKGLMCASGFCYRYEFAKRETVKRIHDGQIGDVSAMHVSYNTGDIWHRGRKPEWTEMEFQVRNWYYFSWLSGDHIVEQHCHNLDKAAWVMKGEMPVAATGLGGRQVRVDPMYGNIYDHFSIIFEYAGGQKLFSNCRQMPRCDSDVSDHIFGTKGSAQLMDHKIKTGGTTWEFEGKNPNMYYQEHVEFIQALRAGKPINDMESAANSTMMAILGRQSAYTGKRLTWKKMLENKEDLSPKQYAWGENVVPGVAKPGQV